MYLSDLLTHYCIMPSETEEERRGGRRVGFLYLLHDDALTVSEKIYKEVIEEKLSRYVSTVHGL